MLPKDINLVTKGHRLSMIMELCVIKRGYGSRIPFGPLGRRIGDSMKPMQVRTIELQFTADEISRYRPLHNLAINTLVKVIDINGKKTVVFDMKQWRALKHYSTWLGFEHLLKYHVDELQEFRTKPTLSLRGLADVACKANSLGRPGESLNELLEWFADGSPKIRWMCWALAELVVKRKEKMLIWVQFPWQQELLYLVRSCMMHKLNNINLTQCSSSKRSESTYNGIILVLVIVSVKSSSRDFTSISTERWY